MVFDLGSRQSFEDVKNYWINEVESYTDASAQLVLVGNKCDCPKQVTEQELQEFITAKKLTYYETSAKTGQAVKDMFIKVATVLSEQNPGLGAKIAVPTKL